MPETPTTPPSSTTIPRIFISHSHFDNTFCRAFVAQLRCELGLTDPDDIFYDESSFHVSDAWLDKIQRKVLACPIFIVILTPHSVVADYVKMEVNLALTETIPHPTTRWIIGVLAEACDVNALAPALRLYQMADIPGKGYQGAFDEILGALRIGGATPPTPSASPSAAPAQPAPAAAPTPTLAQRLGLEAQAAQAAGHWDEARLRAQYALNQPDVAGAPLADALRDTLAQALLAGQQWQAARDVLLAMSPQAQQRAEYCHWLALAERRLNHPDAALAALDNARIFTPYGDTAARQALLAERRSILTEQKRWDEALATLADEESLLPAGVDDSSLVRAKRDLQAAANHHAEALALAEQLTSRPDASASDWLTLARLIRAAHPSPPDADDVAIRDRINQLLAAAVRLATQGGVADPTLAAVIVQARRDLLPPPPPLIPPDQFPQRLASLGFVPQKLNGVAVIIPPLSDLIPAGPFLMGSDKRRDPEVSADELPQHRVTLAAYQIGRFPVTVAEYVCAVRARAVGEPPQGIYRPITWKDQLKQLDYPVVCVSWNDAVAYAVWLATTTGQPWRLPTEAEWEKAARGADGRIYPWGDAWDKTRANTRDGGPGHTTPVGAYPSGASPFHAQDMAGNVWDWCSTLYQSYPYAVNDGRENQNATGNRILRGGSWDDDPQSARAAYRLSFDPGSRSVVVGFRLAVSAPSSARM